MQTFDSSYQNQILEINSFNAFVVYTVVLAYYFRDLYVAYFHIN